MYWILGVTIVGMFIIGLLLFISGASQYDKDYHEMLDNEQLKAIKKTSIMNKKS